MHNPGKVNSHTYTSRNAEWMNNSQEIVRTKSKFPSLERDFIANAKRLTIWEEYRFLISKIQTKYHNLEESNHLNW